MNCWPSRCRAARLIASRLAVASAPPAVSMASITRLSPGRVTTPGRVTAPATWTSTRRGDAAATRAGLRVDEDRGAGGAAGVLGGRDARERPTTVAVDRRVK